VKIDPTITSTPPSATPLSSGAQRSAQGEASTQGANAPATAATTTASTASSSNASTSQNVSLSTLSTQLRALGSGFVNANGDIDTKRVSDIKDAISKGNLSIDASKIADGLIDTVRGLLQNPQSSN